VKQITPASPAPAPLAGAPPSRLRVILIAFGLFIVLGVLANMLLHRGNHYERLADRITTAIANNDMRPVENEFNALRRPQLHDRGKVGRLSDFVNAKGAFKEVKEDTPSGSRAGYHHFVAHFEKGDLGEDMTLDVEGRVADFHVKPLQ
jgi:hypothetical protein